MVEDHQRERVSFFTALRELVVRLLAILGVGDHLFTELEHAVHQELHREDVGLKMVSNQNPKLVAPDRLVVVHHEVAVKVGVKLGDDLRALRAVIWNGSVV